MSATPINPYRGVLFDGQFYNFVSDSFAESLPVQNTPNEAQDRRTFNILGSNARVFTITLVLESEYTVREGDTDVGTTSYIGASRLSLLQEAVKEPDNYPFIFVTPYGRTFYTVPTGAVDFDVYEPQFQDQKGLGLEFRATLTLLESQVD